MTVNVPEWLIALWLLVGAAACAWFWETTGEHAYWRDQANDWRVLFDVDPIRAVLVGIVVFGGLLGILAVFMACWPSVVLAIIIRRWRARRVVRRPRREDDPK